MYALATGRGARKSRLESAVDNISATRNSVLRALAISRMLHVDITDAVHRATAKYDENL